MGLPLTCSQLCGAFNEKYFFAIFGKVRTSQEACTAIYCACMDTIVHPPTPPTTQQHGAHCVESVERLDLLID